MYSIKKIFLLLVILTSGNVFGDKALMTVNTPRKTVAEIVVNINDYPNWYPDITKAYP